MKTKLKRYFIVNSVGWDHDGPYSFVEEILEKDGEHTNAEDAQKIIDTLEERIAILERRKTGKKYYGGYGIVKNPFQTITMPFLIVAKNKYEALGLLQEYLKEHFKTENGYNYHDCNIIEQTKYQHEMILGEKEDENIITKIEVQV